MSFLGVLSVLALAWCAIHIAHYLSTSKDTSLLPISGRTRPRHTHVTLAGIKLHISTTRWNAYHDKLGSFLARRGNQQLSRVVLGFYNAGTVMGALGMVIAIVMVLYTCFGAAGLLLQKSGLWKTNTGQSLLRRSLPDTEIIASPFSTKITPIIPGVTVPISHLPIIIGAVFISQAFHELGHAIAATLEFLPMTACGASLIGCIPAAFVSFPDSGMKNLSSKARSRIISAGPFHNLVFWFCLFLMARLGIFNFISFVSGYRDISDIGKVVVQVNFDSPLSLHVQQGSIITKLDDTPLNSTGLWSKYLQGKEPHTSLGWCVSASVLERSDECCAKSSDSSPFSCFVTHDRLERGCIDPVPVLTSFTERCESTPGCARETVCVIPREDAQLMRLTVSPSIYQLDEATVVLWSGPADEVWEEVQVSSWVPRIWILPLWLPPLLGIFWEYLTMATLSLYFFNLLPLPYLDGEQLLDSLLDLAFETDQELVTFDFGALESGRARIESPRTRRRWKQRIMKYAPYTMVGVVCCTIILSLTNVMT